MLDSEDVWTQALQYANGEMEPTQAAAFEQRLGEEQLAREALAQAVAQEKTLVEVATVQPNPRYRGAVRRRLLGSKAGAARRGQPLLWSLAGVATSLVVLLPVWYLFGNAAAPTAPQSSAQQSAALRPVPAAGARAVREGAEIKANDRLVRAFGDEPRRKPHFQKRFFGRPGARPDRFFAPPDALNE